MTTISVNVPAATDGRLHHDDWTAEPSLEKYGAEPADAAQKAAEHVVAHEAAPESVADAGDASDGNDHPPEDETAIGGEGEDWEAAVALATALAGRYKKEHELDVGAAT